MSGRWMVMAALVSWLTPGLAAAQGPDVRDIRPVVMLLMDTSGSMLDDPSGADPDCFTGEKTRWVLGVEALTGTFQGFSCSSGWSYSFGSQLSSGILDAYLDRIRFGLMTFDGILTVPSHPSDPLVPVSDWTPAFIAQSDGVDGGYSYGGYHILNFPGCNQDFAVDVGARNETPPGGTGAGEQPGNLISVGDELDYASVNQRIQASLLAISPPPNARTPIAGLLEDLEYYYENHPDVAPVTTPGGPGDEFAACRDRWAILITDGAPNWDMREDHGDCATAGTNPTTMTPYRCPYRLPEETAAVLCNMSGGVCDGLHNGLFVIGFNVPGAARDTMNAIADMGGTGDIVRGITSGSDGAMFADDAATLASTLASILDAAASASTSRTVPAFAQVGGAASTAQYQFTTGFRPSEAANEPWTGVFERRRFECSGIDPVAQTVTGADLFHQNLSAARPLYTVVPTQATDVQGYLAGDGATDLGTEGLPVPDLNGFDPVQDGLDLVEFNSGSVSDAHVGGASAADITTFLNRTDSFGDIYHSSPVTIGPPDLDRPDESYNLFRTTAVPDRPTVVYVGTNDGILHAFDVVSGDELWGFVPPAIFGKLDAARTSHQIMVDGTPIVDDVLRAHIPGTAPTAAEYSSVLVVGLRGGGHHYLALDVTQPDPDDGGPKFLWQFTDPTMGDAVGQAAFAQVQMTISNDLHQRTVVIIPGGSGVEIGGACAAPVGVTTGLTGARTDRRCWGTQGRSLFVLDAISGRVLRAFDSTVISAPITGSVAAFPGQSTAISSRAFVNDADGMIWRLDLTSDDPDDWAMTPFHDMFYDKAPDVGEPGAFPPVLSTDEAGNVVVIQGTGNIDALDGNAANRVVSLMETIAFDTDGTYDPATDIAAVLNWDEDLPPGEQVTGPIQLFASNVYFGTFVSNPSATDACAFGYSRLWGVGYIDNAGAFEDPPGVQTRQLGPYENQIIMGVAITRRPQCFTTDTAFDPYGSQSYLNVTDQGGGGYQLVAQMSGGAASAGGGTIADITMDLPAPESFTHVQGRAGSID
jgi:type IV pilus assembly protein PilY1